MELKEDLRRRIRRIRAGLTEAELDAGGERMARRLLDRPEVRRAAGVLCYVSVRREVPTSGILGALRSRGVPLAVPRMTGPGVFEARALTEPLVEGRMGIPTSDGPVMHDIDVCICPGLAFDRHGGRLGYGGGYYDTWLASHDVFAVGLCMEAALVDAVPVEPHDRVMDLVITEDRAIRPPLRVVAAVWIRDGRVLAAQCNHGHREGLWELPGGKVEHGESDAAALERELAEELGCRVTAAEHALAETEHRYAHRTVRLVALEVSGQAQELVLREHRAVRWLGASELLDVPWVPADVDLLPAVRARLANI